MKANETPPTQWFLNLEDSTREECARMIKELLLLTRPGDKWNPARIAREMGAGDSYKNAVYRMEKGEQLPRAAHYLALKKLHHKYQKTIAALKGAEEGTA